MRKFTQMKDHMCAKRVDIVPRIGLISDYTSSGTKKTRSFSVSSVTLQPTTKKT